MLLNSNLLLLHAYLDLVYLRSEDVSWCAVQQLYASMRPARPAKLIIPHASLTPSSRALGISTASQRGH